MICMQIILKQWHVYHRRKQVDNTTITCTFEHASTAITTVYCSMGKDNYYLSLLLERFSSVALGSTILIIIEVFVGVIGNSIIIYFYFFRIKEKGERYFIPLLAIVDFTGCLTSSSFYIMDNTFFFNYPSSQFAEYCPFCKFVSLEFLDMSFWLYLFKSIS